jgi:hypothetical protein
MPVELDLNTSVFQQGMFTLEKTEVTALMKTLRKISQLEWNAIYQDKGLRWEAIQSHMGDDGERLYTIRVTQKCRATVQRRGNRIVFLELHPDHDGAY